MDDTGARSIMRALFPVGWEEAFAARLMARFNDSWSEQQATVRKLRMRYVLRMAAELAEIRKTENFSTGMCEWAIEAIITGDMVFLKDCIGYLSEDEFKKNVGDDERGARYAVLFAKFREICEEALLVLGPKAAEGI